MHIRFEFVSVSQAGSLYKAYRGSVAEGYLIRRAPDLKAQDNSPKMTIPGGCLIAYPDYTRPVDPAVLDAFNTFEMTNFRRAQISMSRDPMCRKLAAEGLLPQAPEPAPSAYFDSGSNAWVKSNPLRTHRPENHNPSGVKNAAMSV